MPLVYTPTAGPSSNAAAVAAAYGRPALPRRTRSRASPPSISLARAESPSPIARLRWYAPVCTCFVLDILEIAFILPSDTGLSRRAQ